MGGVYTSTGAHTDGETGCGTLRGASGDGVKRVMKRGGDCRAGRPVGVGGVWGVGGRGLVAGGESLLATGHRLCGCSDGGHYCLGPLQGVLLGRTVCVCGRGEGGMKRMSVL